MPQCQFLFSVVFGFRKVAQEIFSELDETNCEVPNFTRRRRSPKGRRRGATGWPHHPKARPDLGPRLGCVWPPWPPPLRPYILRIGKTLNTRVIFHEKFRRGRQRRTHLERVLKLFPAPCRRGRSSPEASASPCLPPK